MTSGPRRPDDDNVGNARCLAFYDRNDDGNTVRDGCDYEVPGPAGLRASADEDRHRDQRARCRRGRPDGDELGSHRKAADQAVKTLVGGSTPTPVPAHGRRTPRPPSRPADGMDVITNAIMYRPGCGGARRRGRALGDRRSDERGFGKRSSDRPGLQPACRRRPVVVVVNLQVEGLGGSVAGRRRTGDGRAPPTSRHPAGQALATGIPTIPATSTTCSRWVTSTPPPRRTRCRTSTARGTPTSEESATRCTPTRSPACPVRSTTSWRTTRH